MFITSRFTAFWKYIPKRGCVNSPFIFVIIYSAVKEQHSQITKPPNCRVFQLNIRGCDKTHKKKLWKALWEFARKQTFSQRTMSLGGGGPVWQRCCFDQPLGRLNYSDQAGPMARNSRQQNCQKPSEPGDNEPHKRILCERA